MTTSKIRRLGLRCYNCGSTDTYTNTTHLGKTLLEGYYCAGCGNAYTAG